MPPPESLRALLAGAVDYAGLFPPARLDLRSAAAGYAAYRASDDAWALGRFVAPVARLEELGGIRESVGAPGDVWRVSALLGNDTAADLARIRVFNAAQEGRAVVDSVEGRVGNGAGAVSVPTARDAIERLASAVPRALSLFIEIPLADPAPLVAAIRTAGVRAKIRTGGVTADMIPSPEDVARFLRACAQHGVPFKATAGLHHPIRAQYRLTYDPDAPLGTMFGFLNVLVAAAFVRAHAGDEDVVDILRSEHADEFRFDDDGIAWHELYVPTKLLLESRDGFALSFGSCSFEEPVRDLRRMALL